ncbi:MAG: hypothetical protein JXR48_14170 [Candidatus Delongbacteria bacterium]|nr:hypothetical protein [Candidatus Delongbacteria bacterium]MBN2836101.1 hypothetical protein [Candidatus Delongbacteria bacterium]
MIKKIFQYFGFFKEKRVEDITVKGKPVTDLLSAIDPDFKSEPPKSVLNEIKNRKKVIVEDIIEVEPLVVEMEYEKPTLNNLESLSNKVDTLKNIMEEKEIIRELKRQQRIMVSKQKREEKEIKKQEFDTINSIFDNAKLEFTDTEFQQRKMEVLRFLRDLKKKNSE